MPANTMFLRFSVCPRMFSCHSFLFSFNLFPTRPLHFRSAANHTGHQDAYWIGCLVLLSRVPTLDDLLLLRLPDFFLLNRPRPESLRKAYAHFRTLELRTLKTIDGILVQLNKPILRSSITTPLLQDMPPPDQPHVPSFAFSFGIPFSYGSGFFGWMTLQN